MDCKCPHCGSKNSVMGFLGSSCSDCGGTFATGDEIKFFYW